MVHEPYFESAGINAVAVPMSVQSAHYRTVLHALARVGIFRGALVTMPHKVATVALPDRASTTVPLTGARNAILRAEDGMTPLLRAAKMRGCITQDGTDMLLEQIPAYREFFGPATTAAGELRKFPRIDR